MVRVQLSVTAEDTWTSKFRVEGGKPLKVGIVQGDTDSTVTLFEYDVDGTTVIDTQTMTESQIVEVVDGALVEVGVATGGYGSGTCLVTVRQA